MCVRARARVCACVFVHKSRHTSTCLSALVLYIAEWFNVVGSNIKKMIEALPVVKEIINEINNHSN